MYDEHAPRAPHVCLVSEHVEHVSKHTMQSNLVVGDMKYNGKTTHGRVAQGCSEHPAQGYGYRESLRRPSWLARLWAHKRRRLKTSLARARQGVLKEAAAWLA